jgi:hypothetical protein
VSQRTVGTTSPARAPLGALLLALALPRIAVGATIVVPADQPTIQAAVGAAAAGDTVLVQPGTYTENVRIADGRHRLTIAAADPTNPPTLVGLEGTRDAGIHVDGVDDVTIANLVVLGAYEGVRVDRAYGLALRDVRIVGTGTGIRLKRGGHHNIVEVAIVGTQLAEGIRIDRSPEAFIKDVTVDATRGTGILVRRSRGTSITKTTVSNSRGGHGIAIVRSAHVVLVECASLRNQSDGIRVKSSPDLELRRSQADDNGDVGLRVDRCTPFVTIADLVAANNHASANAQRDMLVVRPNCRGRKCGVTTTTRPGSPTTTVTTTTAPAPTFTPTTTLTTPTTQPITLRFWRLYVHVARMEEGPYDVNVPLRSGDPALVIDVPSAQIAAFRTGDQVTAAEIAALGGDTLQRFENAAAAYIAAHGADYPGFADLESVEWAMRVSGPND